MSNLNRHLEGLNPMCAFTYYGDKICIIEYPEFENVGYIAGWIFVFNTKPYFHSIAGGNENLSQYLVDTYALYLLEHDRLDSITAEEDLEGETTWKLDDWIANEFRNYFVDAMIDAGFELDDNSKWTRQGWMTLEEVLDYVVEQGDGVGTTFLVNDGFRNTFWLSVTNNPDIFEYEDVGVEQTWKSRAELMEMYPEDDLRFTKEND